MTARRRGRYFAAPALLALCLLAGLRQDRTLSGLSERDADEILALLLRSGIDTDKVANKEGVTVSVDKSAGVRRNRAAQRRWFATQGICEHRRPVQTRGHDLLAV